MEQHIKILAAIHIIWNALVLLLGLLIFLVVVVAGAASGEAGAFALTGAVGVILLIVMAAVALPGIIGGYGLLKRRSWSRIVLLIVGALSLMSFPFGTALGIYTIWVLTKQEVVNTLS